ncbi:MAG: hypothetical protein ACC618_04885 [Patescibacteria group bacterium]
MNKSSDLESQEGQAIQTPERILKQAVLDTNKLDEEHLEALKVRDSETVRRKLKERAEIVAQLPERIIDAQAETGQEFPEDELKDLRDLQFIAEEALKRGKAFELGVILDYERGSKENEPNLLEQITNRLYSQSN